MNRPTKPDEILAMPAVERDAYAAEVLGWFVVTRKCTDVRWYARGELGEYIMKESDWQPSQPTEKGKAQCWDLVERLGLIVMPDEVAVMYRGKGRYWHRLEGNLGELQIITETAAILCALAEKEK